MRTSPMTLMPVTLIPVTLILPLTLLLSACDVFTGPADDERPSVVQVSPAAGTNDASVLTVIELTFSTDLDAGTAGAAVSLHAGDQEMTGTLWLKGGRTLRLVPSTPLDFGTDYEIRVVSTLADTDGRELAGDLSYHFTTHGTPPPAPDQHVLRELLGVLAHDSLRGRGSGTPDEARAAEYIEHRFSDYGLEPPNGSYTQDFQAMSRFGATVTSRNVLGAVPGSGALADEWVVVGAHYDHLGIRQAGDGSLQVHNGADDNGSGTITVMELARLYSSYVTAGGTADLPRRSVLFAAWGAEEVGLLGSCAFTQTDIVPTEQTMAMLNFDMVGRLRENRVQAHGPKSAERWWRFLADANKPALDVAQDPAIGCQSCSDHACFRNAGVPYVWFFTGSHPEYHSPADDTELIDFDGTARIADMAFRLLTRLAVTPDALAFTDTPAASPPG